jgi:HK97 family phage prohead protease
MPDPGGYDNEDDFISACIKQRQDEHPEEDSEQSAAICYSMWSEKSMTQIVRKTHADMNHVGMEFVLSDMTPDRYGDVIMASGWDLKNFLKNPIALFNHNSDFPIGRWENLNVKDGALRGHLRLAPEGTSSRIDEIRKLVNADILRATSVGFRPLESEPLEKSGGLRYIKHELVETSLVSVPANPNALAVSKSLKISDGTLQMVFKDIETVQRSVVTRPQVIVPETKSTLWQGKEVPVSPKRMTSTWQGKVIADDTY